MSRNIGKLDGIPDSYFDSIDIQLMKYGIYPVKNSLTDYTKYDIAIREENGNIIEVDGVLYGGNDAIEITSPDLMFGFSEKTAGTEDVIAALKNNSTLTFKIKEVGDYAYSSYVFDVDCVGFSELYDNLDPKIYDWN